jgi:hypothetical protein
MNAEKISQVKQFEGITPHFLACFKYAPVVSAEVERSFSIYKTFLANNRRSFIFDNIRKHMIIQFNNNKK